MEKLATFEMLLDEVKSRADGGKRLLVAIAGPPGSGKSTLAERLASCIGPSAAVLPMDGFHLDNAILRQKGLLDCKGAPETFDADGFVELVRLLTHQSDLTYPTFDREEDRTVPDRGRIDAGSDIVLVEGNYLLLDNPPWSELAEVFEMTVKLTVDRSELERRLIERWLNHGLSASAAKTRAQENDVRNAELVLTRSRPSDFIYEAD
ncbi:fructokinase [Aliiroseovarius halocynthiae]|uniref:Phosphoribulokinase n=1 Tax=Aliiroseovarius halocynthiae TaxID=985055 RepID=A0A545SNB4_9RHOB|nr:phosphoribulokinase [Aliiroseovarius halocynthiae]TQV66447.1 phosphoribulokinase [Aliiroseovarius halocynthiae]SMR83597.1 fructokinase [Aliiroseovarius halocynthiae]